MQSLTPAIVYGDEFSAGLFTAVLMLVLAQCRSASATFLQVHLSVLVSAMGAHFASIVAAVMCMARILQPWKLQVLVLVACVDLV